MAGTITGPITMVAPIQMETVCMTNCKKICIIESVERAWGKKKTGPGLPSGPVVLERIIRYHMLSTFGVNMYLKVRKREDVFVGAK
jgi:hypothetical protein